MHGRLTNPYKILVKKPDGKIPSGRSRHRWEDNIRMNLRKRDFESMQWIHLVE
jgi:hypothetical protein